MAAISPNGGGVLGHAELHNYVTGNVWAVSSNHDLYFIINHIVHYEVTKMPVPLFFIFSGYLFFIGLNPFSFSVYGDKLKKRFRSLLIPYLFWNLVVLSLYLALKVILPSLPSDALLDYTLVDCLRTFWAVPGTDHPLCYQFWFLRDLMMAVILSPLIFLIIRYTKVAGVVLVSFIWFIGWPIMPTGFSSIAFFFFVLGGWLRINMCDFVSIAMRVRKMTGMLYLLILAVNTLLWYQDAPIYFYMQKLGILVGMVAVIGWVGRGLECRQLHTNAVLSGSSFFIYAYHGLWIALLGKLWVKLLPVTTGTLLLGYVLLPSITLAVGVGLYVLLRRWFPRMIAMATGGR